MPPSTTYTEDITHALVLRLERARAFPKPALVEYAATLGFWIGEVKHCLAVIDGYSARMDAMKTAQQEYALRQKGLQVRENIFPTTGASQLPGLKTGKRKDLRTELVDAIRNLLYRLHEDELIDEPQVRQAALDLAIEASIP